MHRLHGSYQHCPILLKHAFQVIILCILHAALGKSNYAESVPEPFDNSVQTILFYSYDNIYIRIVELNVEAKCAMKGCNEKNKYKGCLQAKAWLTLG